VIVISMARPEQDRQIPHGSNGVPVVVGERRRAIAPQFVCLRSQEAGQLALGSGRFAERAVVPFGASGVGHMPGVRHRGSELNVLRPRQLLARPPLGAGTSLSQARFGVSSIYLTEAFDAVLNTLSQGVSATPDAKLPSSMPPFASPASRWRPVDDMSKTQEALCHTAFSKRA
jgi:hypothetical protein